MKFTINTSLLAINKFAKALLFSVSKITTCKPEEYKDKSYLLFCLFLFFFLLDLLMRRMVNIAKILYYQSYRRTYVHIYRSTM